MDVLIAGGAQPQNLITGAGLAYIQRRLAAQQPTTTER